MKRVAFGPDAIAATIASLLAEGIPIVRVRQSPAEVSAALGFGELAKQHTRRVDWHPAYPMKAARKEAGVHGKKAAKRWRKAWRSRGTDTVS